VDFAGEVERSLLALDGAVLIISAVEGVQSHTENLWNALCRLHIPVMILINKIDRMGSHAMDIAETLAASLPLPDKDDSRIFIPMQSLTGEESRNCRVLRDETAESRITEAAADLDDDIAERFLMEEDIPWSDISDVIAHATAEMRAVPVYFASAQNAVGITELMDGIISWLPSAADTVTDSLSARVFRIEHDKTMGKIAHVRMYGGSLTARASSSAMPESTSTSIPPNSWASSFLKNWGCRPLKRPRPATPPTQKFWKS